MATKEKYVSHSKWRAVVVCLLTALGIVAFTLFSVVHWTERQVLTTSNWVTMVAPLPRNDTVAGTLSNYSVQQVFTSLNVTQRIQQALPDQTSFLAPTLSSQLQTRVDKQVKRVIKSDVFSSVWTSANRVASERLIASARGAGDQSVTTQHARFSINLDSLKNSISSMLGETVSAAPAASSHLDVAVDLRASLNKIKSYIRAADFLNGTLGWLALVCLLGAVSISLRRHRLVLTIGLLIALVALLQLVAIKVFRPTVLNQVQNSAYRPAAGVVYDTVLATFRRTAVAGLVIGAVLALLYFIRPTYWNRSRVLARWWQRLRGSAAGVGLRQFRQDLWQYRWPVTGAAVFVWLLLMAFVFTLNWQSVVRIVLFIALTVEIINLAAARPGVHMEQT